MMQNTQEIRDAIAHERMMAQSIVLKCKMIEQLIDQNLVSQQEINKLREETKKLQEVQSICKSQPEPSS